jgi:ATP-dependent Clp protease ATP-binding subunit ClpA
VVVRVRDAVLDRFTRDLTEEARAGRLDPVRCRDAEIARVIDILLRYGKNNPALVGPAGVGKTAIVEGLAQRVVAGAVPLVLRDVRVLSLDHVALLGGTTYRGQYEARITGLVESVTGVADVILFIDELHNLIGQGSAMGAAMDAGNMLKPALVRGDFRVIGATTSEEYLRWVCGDPALERRFQRVDVRELSAADTLEILRARVHRLERHHGVVIADDALEAAVTLTDEHITDRARPDRAIDALDEACAHTQALAVYTPAAAALLAERRLLLRTVARVMSAGRLEDATGLGEPSPGPEGELPDPIERFARTGLDALERFGAELEAVIAGRLNEPRQRRPASAAADPAAPSAAAPTSAPTPVPARARTLAELDTLLRAQLADEGVVVRGHDVARAVAVATGRFVAWRMS